MRTEAEMKAHDAKIVIGTRVVLSGGDFPEYGVVIHTWHNKILEGKDCYIAFTGTSPLDPGDTLGEKPYVLRYTARSLWLLEDFLNLELRDQALVKSPNHWQIWPIVELARIAVRDRDREKMKWLIERFWEDDYEETYMVEIFQKASPEINDKYDLHALLISMKIEY